MKARTVFAGAVAAGMGLFLWSCEESKAPEAHLPANPGQIAAPTSPGVGSTPGPAGGNSPIAGAPSTGPASGRGVAGGAGARGAAADVKVPAQLTKPAVLGPVGPAI